MLARTSAPIEGERQAVLFYLYADDLAALRDQLLANGVAVGRDPRRQPRSWTRDGLADPDGWCLMVAEIE
jgi:hypothetical protein